MSDKTYSLINTLGILYKKYIRLIRFGIVGVINTGVDFGTFTVFSALLNTNPLVSQVIGYSAGVANSFVMNKLWTFESKSSKAGTQVELVKFIVINAASLGISLAGLKVLNGQLGVNVYIAKAIVTVLAQIVNFLGYKLWVFRNPA